MTSITNDRTSPIKITTTKTQREEIEMGGETKQNWLIAVLEIIMADSAFIFLINILIRVARFVRDSIVKYLLFANYRSRLISYKV